jgi:hypothetical protein
MPIRIFPTCITATGIEAAGCVPQMPLKQKRK